MGETGEGGAAVAAEAVVLKSISVGDIRSVHMEVVVLVEEEMMREIVSMIKTGGLEAVVLALDVGEEVEALGEKGIGVLQPGKAVLKEELRLSNGTGNGNRWILEISMITIIIASTIMMMNGMVIIIVISTMILSSSSSSSSAVDAKSSFLLPRSSLSYLTQLTVLTCIQVGLLCKD